MSPDTCLSRWLMAQPLSGSSARIFRRSRSKVPWTKSDGLLIDVPIGYRYNGTPLPLGNQGESMVNMKVWSILAPLQRSPNSDRVGVRERARHLSLSWSLFLG